MDSLFYIKEKISDNCEINVSISCDNVYYRCARCGAEQQTDLASWGSTIAEDDIDMFGTVAYCSECSEEVIKKANGQSEN